MNFLFDFKKKKDFFFLISISYGYLFLSGNNSQSHKWPVSSCPRETNPIFQFFPPPIEVYQKRKKKKRRKTQCFNIPPSTAEPLFTNIFLIACIYLFFIFFQILFQKGLHVIFVIVKMSPTLKENKKKIIPNTQFI